MNPRYSFFLDQFCIAGITVTTATPI